MRRTMLIELSNGGRLEIDPGLIIEWGREGPVTGIPLIGEITPILRAGRPYNYIKVAPFDAKLIITDQSLRDVIKAKQI